MSSTSDFIIKNLHQSLKNKTNKIDIFSLEAAFIKWICLSNKEIFTASLPIDITIMDYRHVAQVAFLCEADNSIINENLNYLKDGLKRMSGRPVKLIGGATAAFKNDVIALLGLAIGARIVGSDLKQEIKKWLESFVVEGSMNLAPWKKCVAYSALKILDSEISNSVQTEGEVSDIRLSLKLAGIEDIEKDGDIEKTLSNIMKAELTEEDNENALAGIRLKALEYVIENTQNLSIKSNNVSDLILLLERVPSAFRRWTWEESKRTANSTIQRWDIQNEYHVQNFLYFLLSPIFPDIEDEFYADQIAQLNPRADLGIPSMQLIIEVKFMRNTSKFQKIVEEIAADNSLYFKLDSQYNSKYKKLLVFVWDDSSRTHEYDKFKQGINSLGNVLGTVIIPRPGNLTKVFKESVTTTDRESNTKT